MFSKAFKIGIFLSISYYSFQLDAFIVGLLWPNLKLAYQVKIRLIHKSDEQYKKSGKIEMPFLNCIEIIVGKGSFALYEQMIYFRKMISIAISVRGAKRRCFGGKGKVLHIYTLSTKTNCNGIHHHQYLSHFTITFFVILQIMLLSIKLCRPWSEVSYRSPLIWVCTVCKISLYLIRL